MAYIQGFVIPVPRDRKEAYRQMAIDFAPYFEGHGAMRTVEGWGDDVPRGETTDMYGAVNAEAGENVVFSWVEWPSKQAWQSAHKAIGEDETMQPPADMPFDPARMIYAGFEPLGEAGDGGAAGYVQGYVAPVPRDNREAFAAMCATMREVMIDSGALRALDGWAGNIADGKVTDFKRAVKAEMGEAVAFGFVEWPSKTAFGEGMAKVMADSRMPPPGSDMPLDGRRMIYGGFEVLLDTAKGE